MPDTLEASARDRSQEAFAEELGTLLEKYRLEWDLSIGGCISVLLGEILETWFDGYIERILEARGEVDEGEGGEDADPD